MKKVILTKGLPASGKTTWAKVLMVKEPGKWKRINKDDLRAMLDDSKWSRENEDFVIDERDRLILFALNSGKNVIVDDTNLASKHESRIRDLVKGIAEVEIKDFTDVPLEECIKRDQNRSNYVGEKVIKQMYTHFLEPKFPVIITDPRLPNAIICDIDGTLALFGDKNPYDRDFSEDTFNYPVGSLVQQFKPEQVIYVSGREEKHREVTENWLKGNEMPFSRLLMRKTEDKRKDSIVKKEIYDEHIAGKYNISFVLDDRDRVVKFWRSIGLTCFQVAEGDF